MRRLAALLIVFALVAGLASCGVISGAITPPPSEEPSVETPSTEPSASTPTTAPTADASADPTDSPSDEPTAPSDEPTDTPSDEPSTEPSDEPAEPVVGELGIAVGTLSGDDVLDAAVLDVIDTVCSADNDLETNLGLLFDWMTRSLTYKYVTVDLSNGYTDELVNDLARYIVTGLRGSCEHNAALMKVFCDRLGAPAVVVAGDFLSEDGSWVEHAWAICEIDGVYRHIDVLYGRNHTQGRPRTMFMKTDEEFTSTHRWEESDYPACE